MSDSKPEQQPKQVVSRPKNDKEWAHRKVTQGRTMLDYLQRSLCVTLTDGRLLVGRFVAFDPHMNVVLAQAHEYPSGTGAVQAISGKAVGVSGRRDVGLVILRGEHVSNVTALKKKGGVTPAGVNAPGDAAAVPGAALAKSNVPQLPKQSGQRRARVEED